MKTKMTLLASLVLCAVSGQAFATDMSKVLRVAFPAPETGFDPAKTNDLYSSSIIENIFDTLVTYDYNARPVKLVPNTLTAMPTISADGKVYTFKIKPGIYFAPDAAFKGQKRELTAADYAYSIKRHLDPTVASQITTMIDGRFLGAKELVAAAGKGKLNYDAPLEGIKALDKYTLQITLVDADPNFLPILAMNNFGAVAREVIESTNNTNAKPVGTGPYALKEWRPGNKIVLEANPNFRTVMHNGKKLPKVGRVEVSVLTEEQPRWLAFVNKQLDLVELPQTALKEALVIDPANPLKVSLAEKYAKDGIKLNRTRDLSITYHFFNMDDPVVGGNATDKIALRRAIAMSYPRNEVIAKLYAGQRQPMQYVIPEGISGHNPQFKGQAKYDRAAANALLDKFGYKIGADGFRTQPNGQPLVVELGSVPTGLSKQLDEYWQESFDALKIKLKFKSAQWNELVKEARAGKLQMWGLGWGATYNDGTYFMQLLHSKNIGDSNHARFKNAEYDQLFNQSKLLPNGPARNKLFDRMNQIIVAQQPWVLGDYRMKTFVTQRYVKDFAQHPFVRAPFRYVDVTKK